MFRSGDSDRHLGQPALLGHVRAQRPGLDAQLPPWCPHFTGKWLLEGKNQMADLLEMGEKKYQVNGNMVRSGQTEETYEFMGITYWVDVTEYDRVREEYLHSRPVVMIVLVDNYDEMMKPLTDRQRTELRGALDGAVEKWCEGKGGILRRTDRDRYMFIFEKRHLDDITRERFTLVESIHSLVSPTGIHTTVSIGVGFDGAGYEEDYAFAALAEDMALSRGGDQAVVKNRYNFEFFGGRGGEVETRTKVKSRVTANSLSRLIGDASRVFVMGHKYADNDAVGAAAGIVCITRHLGKEAHIVLGEENSAGPLSWTCCDRTSTTRCFSSPRRLSSRRITAPCWWWWTPTAPSRWRTRPCSPPAATGWPSSTTTGGLPPISRTPPFRCMSPTPLPPASSYRDPAGAAGTDGYPAL